MHVLLVPSWYKTPEIPTRGSFFTEQAQMLQRAGHQVGMLVPPSILRTWNGLSEVSRFWRRSPTDLIIDESDGFPTYRVPWWGWRGSVNPLSRPALMSQAFERYVHDHGVPDIIHGHSIIYGGYISSALSEKYGIPFVVTEHDVKYFDGIIPLHIGHQIIVKKTVARLKRVIAVSGSFAKALRPFVGGIPIDIIGNVIDAEMFRPSDQKPQECFVFTSIGMLKKRKGLHILLKAFARQFK